MLELRQLAAAAAANNNNFDDDDDNDNSDNNSAAASEDSNPIIWEDDAGTDLRHLFTRSRRRRRQNNNDDNNNNSGSGDDDGELLPTMTQQVDEMMNMRDSDDDDSSDDDHHDNKVGDNASTLTPPPAAAAVASRRSKKQKLLDSGDIPATISKLKRRRRHTNNDQKNDGDDDNEIISSSSANACGNNNLKKRHHSLPLGDRGGRMMMLGGRRDTTIDNSDGEFGLLNNQDFGKDDDDDDGVENLLKEIEQGLDQVCSSYKTKKGAAAVIMGGEFSGSCPKSATTTATAAAASTNNNIAHPSIALNGNEKKIGTSSLYSIQPFGIKNANAVNAQPHHHSVTISTTQRDAANKPGMQLFSRNSSSSNNDNNNNTAAVTVQPCPQPVVASTNNPKPTKHEVDNVTIYDFDNDDEEEYMRCLGADATSSSSQGSQAEACCTTNNNNSTPAPAVTATITTSGVLQQCPPPTTAAASFLSDNNEVAIQANNNGSYDFLDNYGEDDDDDDVWANVDLSGTQQCPADDNTAIQRGPSGSNGVVVGGGEAINQETDAATDDYFDDDIDFSALDKQVEQRFETIGDSNVVPPPNALIHNRRCDPTPNLSKEPLFLSLTRYVVRRVRDDLNTYTKTIDVSLWTPKEENVREDELGRLKKICSTEDDASATVSIDGCIHLRGEWYHTNAKSGDVIHLCSISGTYLTDVTALPVILHSNPPEGSDVHDDLVLVIHPDELITPTLISEAVKCPRLAVLQSRLGSTGLSAKSAVIGTLRHDLFERCVVANDTSRRSAALFTRDIIRNNAEALVGCGITDRKEAFGEVMKTIPQITSFLDTYTSWNTSKKGQGMASTKHGGALLKGMFPPYDTFLSIDSVAATEEWALVPELGLKGNVDATVLGRIKPVHSSTAPNIDNLEQNALVPVELKTGHNQNPQHNHLAQLSVYTIMLRARHGSAFNGDMSSINDEEASDGIERGAASSGMLLYLNDKSFCAKHVKPSLSDIKTLVGQRNGIVCDVLNAARPRGIALEYQEDKRSKQVVVVNEPPSSALPPLLSNTSSCERCYKNRECMMYTSADNVGNELSSNVPRSNLSHRRLIDHFTGHLQGADLNYFRRWDRLIDLERHARPSDIAKSWLYNSDEKEAKDGKCISSVILDETHLSATLIKTNDSDADGNATIRFRRSTDSKLKQPITNLHFETGTYVIIRTDEDSLSTQRQQSGNKSHARRQRILIFRGSVASVTETSIDVVLQQKDVSRLRPKKNGSKSMFRIDRDELSNGAGLLLQNLG